MRALPDVDSVQFDIKAETFTVELAAGGRPDAVLGAIRGLGFEPTQLDAAPASAPTPERVGSPTSARFEQALARSRRRGVALIVSFGGSFCSACQAFKQDVLGDGRVQAALRAFELLELDVAQEQQAAADLGVTAVPDIWVLSAEGLVLGRENRTMSAAEFLTVLARHTQK